MSEVDVIRIPGARPVYKQKAEHHLKEQNWDDRFVLGRIPVYDATRDKHCVALTVSGNKKKKTVLAPGKIRRARSPSSTAVARPPRSGSVKGLASDSKNVMRGNLLHKLRNDVGEGWAEEGVPEEIYGVLLRAIESCTAKARITALARELEDLRNRKSVVKTLFDVISAREQSIKILERLAESGATRAFTEAEVRAAQEALLHHRVMTLYAVENIAVFREHVYKLTQGDRKLFRVPILWGGANYLLKLKSDTSFLATSALADFFEFSKKSDPFFVMPASQGLKKGKLDLPFPAALVGRVKAAENVILDETYANKDVRAVSREAPRRANKPPEYPSQVHRKPDPSAPGLPPTRPKPDPVPQEPQLESENQSPQRVVTPKRVPSSDTSVRPVARGKAELDPSGEMKTGEVEGFKAKDRTVEDTVAHAPGEKASETVSRIDVKPAEMPSIVPQPADIPAIPTAQPPAIPKQPVPSDLDIQSFPQDCSQLRVEIEDYIASLPVSIRESFWSPGSFDTLLKQTYPAFMSLNKASKRVGLLALYIDTLATNVKRVFISHISAGSIPDLDAVLDASLEFIWKSFPCDEVRIALNYREIDGKMEADSQIKAVIASKRFRWKNLTNTADGRRVIIMAVLRPEEAPERPIAFGAFFGENLTVRYGAVTQLGDGGTEASDSGPFSLLGITACLKELGGLTPCDPASPPLQLALADLHSKLPGDFVFPAFRLTSSDDLQSALEVIRTQELDPPGLEPGLLTSSACCSLGLRFTSFDTCLRSTPSGVCEYIRISDTEVNSCRLGERNVSLFPSDDKQFNLIVISPVSEKDGDALTLATDVVRTLTQTENPFSATAPEIWLPGFSVSHRSVLSGLNGLRSEKGGVQTCAEAFNMSLRAQTHQVGNIKLSPSENSVLIEEEFIIGKNYAAVLNSKLDEVTPVPYCACHVPFSSFHTQTS